MKKSKAKSEPKTYEERLTQADKDRQLPWDGREVSFSYLQKTITPRLVGPAVERFKAMWGVCTTEGCSKIDKHDGECSQAKDK